LANDPDGTEVLLAPINDEAATLASTTMSDR
jgi:hypothetical protein